MNTPLVSVVIPSYGGGEYLQRAVDSVLLQTYPNVEAIVIDDNGVGTPNQIATAKKMDKYKGNEFVKYICHEVNKNGSAARNTGAQHSIAKYIALLDDDDEYLPEKIERQVKLIEQLDDSYALVYCGHETFVDGKSIGITHKNQSGHLFYEVMKHDVIIGSTSFLIRRTAWESVAGFDESFRRHQDWEFTARIAYLYKVCVDDFVGFKRHIMKRNSPQSPDVVVNYRLHYLKKMEPYMACLTSSQQKDIVVVNMMDACIQYLKYRRVKDFVKLYMKIQPGYRGVKFIYNRLKLFLLR